jgi:hypothetical protein
VKFLPPNTLAYHNAAPQVHQNDLSGLPTSVFSAATLKYRKDCDMTFPNDEAVTFYTLNHCASVVRKTFTENEPLPQWAEHIMSVYTDVTMAQGERMLHYILSITTREMRHLKTSSAGMWSEVKKIGGQEAVDFLKNISSNGDESVAVKKYMEQPPNLTIGQYTKALAYAFHHGTWNGSYGGHPWGNVTDAVVSMLTGATSMEMLVDTGYTLAHNGGPIFNKGMMYKGYDGHFMTILDVQRSGQLPDLMLDTQTLGIQKTPQALVAVGLIKTHMPQEIKGYVDWKLVDDFRPEKDKKNNPHKYQTQLAKQAAKAASPLHTKMKPVTASSPAAKPVLTQIAGKKVKKTGEWLVYPHQTVAVYEREQQP